MKTPKGVYNFTHAFGINENPGIKSFDYIKVDKHYYWVDDIKSTYYNKFVYTRNKNIAKDWNSAEHIIDYPKLINMFWYLIIIKSVYLELVPHFFCT